MLNDCYGKLSSMTEMTITLMRTPPKITISNQRGPPQHDGLLAFETDLYRLAKNIKFRYVRNQFQTKLAEDAKCIKNSEHIFVPAD